MPWQSMKLAGCVAAIVGSSWLSGCALITLPVAFSIDFDGSSPESSARKSLPVVDQTGVSLELYFVERPPHDLLMQEALWQELDQIATVPAETREQLRANGLRFAIVPANPPYALRALMETTSAETPGSRTLRREYQMPSGVAHQFPCQVLHDTTPVRLVTPDGIETREYQDGRCIFRCQVQKTQAGWARVEIVPEIHHGQNRMRPVANDQDWDFTGGQLVDALYGQRFAVELNEGESIVLGGLRNDPQSVGARFFHTGDAGRPTEKLLVIRLKSMDRVAAVRQTDW